MNKFQIRRTEMIENKIQQKNEQIQTNLNLHILFKKRANHKLKKFIIKNKNQLNNVMINKREINLKFKNIQNKQEMNLFGGNLIIFIIKTSRLVYKLQKIKHKNH